jgi:hypothetical protein
MAKRILAVVLVLVAGKICAQGPVSTTENFSRIVVANHASCIKAYSQRFAKTKETPSDIAQASLVYCTPQLGDVKTAYLSFLKEQGDSNASSWDELSQVLEERATRNSIKTVLDTRYPQIK